MTDVELTVLGWFGRAEAFVHTSHNQTGQTYAGKPYSKHLKAVDNQLWLWLQPVVDKSLVWELRFAGLLHDYFEDVLLAPEIWPLAIQQLHQQWQVPLIAIDMALLCTDPAQPGWSRKERKAVAYRRIAQCNGALLIKLADRCCNVRASLAVADHHLEVYLQEHESFTQELCRRTTKRRYPRLEQFYQAACTDYQQLIHEATEVWAKRQEVLK